jgi:hypothetical protein
MIGCEQMNTSQKNNKTIDFNSTKRQRSSKNSDPAYFNPYSREADYPSTSTYHSGITYRDRVYNKNSQNNYNKDFAPVHISEGSPELRKKQLKERNKLSKSQIRKNKKRRQQRLIFNVTILMAFTVVTVWGGLNIKDILTYPRVSYQVVESGRIDNSRSFEGIIIRDEKVYYSESEGTMQTIIGEGERVKKEGEVCVLVDNNGLTQTEQEKDKTSSELYNAADKRKQLSYYQDDIYQIDTIIRDTLNTFYGDRDKDNTDYVYSIRTQLDSQVNKRTGLYMKEQSSSNTAIVQKLNLLDNRIGGLKYISIPGKSGIISYSIDGQETKLNSKTIDTMHYEMFKELNDNEYQNIGNNTYVTKGMPLYKVILDDIWHIVTYIDSKDGEFFKQGNSYTLDFDTVNHIKINFILKSKITEDKKIKLVFETSDQIGNFLGQRNVSFSIGNKNEEGLKIPLTSIVEQNMIRIPSEYKVQRDGEIGVYRKKGEVSEFVKIMPQYENAGGTYILQQIGEADCIQINDILSHPNNGSVVQIEEIQTTQGVYVINGKLAQFKAVNIYLQTNEYALIKYTADNELKELDKIISNPKSIKRDQLLQHMNIQNE